MTSLIKAAFISTRFSICYRSSLLSPFSSSLFQRIPISVQPITVQFTTKLGFCSQHLGTRNETDNLVGLRFAHNKTKIPETLLRQLRKKKALTVSALADLEWREKPEKFKLCYGGYGGTEAREAGLTRHAELEKEVSEKVQLSKRSVQHYWAVTFMNFLICAKELLLKELTREMPLVGIVNDIWMVGRIDEIRMPVVGTVRNPSLVDNKTRLKAELPPESQKRYGRFQLMCYKYLWDTVVTDDFPVNAFFDHFDLNPQYIISKELQEFAANSGFTVKTLKDLVMLYKSTCCTLPPSQDQLLLRYEYQKGYSLLGEDNFTYDPNWLKNRINYFLGLLLRKRCKLSSKARA